jgi:hypothetical protein
MRSLDLASVRDTPGLGQRPMATTIRHIRGSWIALAAVLAASSMAGDASACSMKTSAAKACAMACGCCSSASDEAPAVLAGLGEPAAVRPFRAACETAPGRGCSCGSQEPSAPAPKPARGSSDRRTESTHAADVALVDEGRALRVTPSPQLPLTASPPKMPLYLRNERLLF